MPEFQCSGPISVEVSVPTGSVKITAEERDSAHVEVTPFRDNKGSSEAAEATVVEFGDGKLLIEVPRGRSKWWSRGDNSVKVEARVPLESDVRVGVATADVKCVGTYGRMNANSASANVVIGDVIGDAEINTASGDIQVGAIGGGLKVHSASGDVEVDSVGGSLSTKTASGDIKVGAVGDDIETHSSSGDLLIGSIGKGEVLARTVSGDVRLQVVQGTGVWLDLSSLSGNISNSLDSDDGDAEGDGGAGESGDSSVGSGDGSGSSPDLTIHARTVSGDIRIDRAAEPASV